MGIAEEFQILRANYIIPADTVSSISKRYKRITRQLNKDFWNSESETDHSFYSGSYGRDTAVHGISDLDVVFELPKRLYDQYRSHVTNGPSALLQAVKRSINSTYTTSEMFGDGQVVVIEFSDGIRFEVLPGFANGDGGFTYPNANQGGSWQWCDPRAEIQAISIRNAVCNYNLKELCRIARVWRDHVNAPMSGMLIDTLAYQFIEGWQYRTKSFLYYDFMCRDFFGFLAKQDQRQNHWRAPGSGSYVWRSGAFEHKARSAETWSKQAISEAESG